MDTGGGQQQSVARPPAEPVKAAENSQGAAQPELAVDAQGAASVPPLQPHGAHKSASGIGTVAAHTVLPVDASVHRETERACRL